MNWITNSVLPKIKALVQADSDSELNQSESVVGVNFAINTFLTERIEETISGYNSSIVINIFGDNLDSLDQDAQKIVFMLQKMKGASDIMLQSPPGTPQVSIKLRSEKMSQLGILKTDVLDTIKAAYEGFPASLVYDGIVPDLFKEGSGVVILGFLRNETFYAEEVLAKHDENYMPPNLNITNDN